MAVTTEYEPDGVAPPPDRWIKHRLSALSSAGGSCSRPRRDEKATLDAPRLQVRLLGGFRIERVDSARLACDWRRRSAKTLTKLLATCPGHTVHREQLIEILWPGADLDSGLNSFGKALYAARHALEPELPPRSSSRYLSLVDGMVALNMRYVVVDADRFEQLAESALRHRGIDGFEAALACYGGELLPEDRYEDWCADRRASLGELHVRLLLGLADALEERGAYDESTDCLRQVVAEDPTREEIHRRLIRLWATMGNRDQAVRQFHACREALRRELDLLPQRETVALYEDVLAGRVPSRSTPGARDAVTLHRPSVHGPPTAIPLVGRGRVLDDLLALVERRRGSPPMLLLTGEAGVGKTRLLEILASEASRTATVLRGEVGAHVSHLPYGPVAVALDRFAAARPERDRRDLARRYPALAHFVPSLSPESPAPAHDAAPIGHLEFLLASVRALSDLASTQPVLFVVDDLHGADPPSLEVLRYFAHLGRERRWLFVATVREEELQICSGVTRTLESMLRDGLCRKLELPCLSQAEGRELIRELSADERIDDDLARRICARSGGNPLFIEALVAETHDLHRRFSANRREALSAQPETEVPPRVRLLVTSTLRAFDDSVRRVLTLAAVVDTADIDLDRLLAAAAALESPIGRAALFDALDVALSVRILEEREGRYSFRHPLVRAVLCRDLSRHRREELHAALYQPHGEPARRLRVTASS